MQPLQSYPVFEADQVLSNGHLNNLLNYLEQQERLTRIKTIGNGIVCGLEINSSDTALNISKGCGLTSQGYLVQLCETNYTDFIAYTPPVLPNDLYFLTQCGEENRNDIPYYSGNDIFELISDSDIENEAKRPLTSLNLRDFVVVLFLEAEQVNLKNCDTQDCNDKGSRMDFILRVLLVKKEHFNFGPTFSFNSVFLKRFNVPVSEIKTTEDILQGFLAITDDTTLTRLSENLFRTWEKFAISLGLPEENPLVGLNLIDVKKRLSGNTGQRIFLQYFYDFVDDLLKAYAEFWTKARETFGKCCPDEMDFPLHLTLGLASEDTVLGKRNIGRQYFESSPIVSGQAKTIDEAAILLERLVAMIKGFNGEKLKANEPIVITPSTLGYELISSRAIPYYYDWQAVSPVWYFSRSYHGDSYHNLGYRASEQTDAPDAVKNPLLYDIERFNAFRIEGHIGKDYRTAITDIIKQKQRFNLPFDVLALNAADLSAVLTGKEIRCHVEDLESDYSVMITGIVCKLQQIMAYVGNLRPKRAVDAIRDSGSLSLKKDFYISKNLVDMKKTIKADVSKNQAVSISNADIIKNLALRDVEPGEKLADFVAQDVSLFIVNQKEFFEYIIQQPDLLLIFLQQLSEIVKYLLSFDLDKFDEEAYNKLWTPYSKTVESLIKDAANSGNEEIKRYFSASNTELLFKCANEKLFALKDEYLKRMEQYHAAINFNAYFKKHPGLEHKAAVPKGGTFILVYNGETERILTIPELNIPNLNLDLITRDTSTSFLAKEILATSTDTQHPKVITHSSKLSSEPVFSSKRTEFEFASDLIMQLNLGDDAKKVLDALDIRDKEIRDQATPIAKGTVIADFYLPYLCCSECPPIAYVIAEEKEPEPENKPPIANAGPDQTLTFTQTAPITATLNGAASTDEDGSITTFYWAQKSGPSTTIISPHQAQTTVQIQAPGEYIFVLKVVDDKGASAEDSVTINVIAPENKPPIADAGQDQSILLRNPNTPGTVTLNGSNSSDPEGGELSFSWTFEGGSMIPTITSPEEVQTTVTGLLAGEYKFGLKVTDQGGNSSMDSVTVLVAVRGGGDDVNTKTCGPLAEILKTFGAFDQRDSDDLFKRFLENYPAYGQVKKFILALANTDGESPDKQVEFLVNEFVNTGLLSQFVEWLQGLHKIITEVKELRSLAFELYRILNLLVIYIVCIQKEDYDVAKIPTENIIKLIEEHANSWAAMLASGDLGRVESQLVLRIANDFDAAMGQTEENGEVNSKANYLNHLKKIGATI